MDRYPSLSPGCQKGQMQTDLTRVYPGIAPLRPSKGQVPPLKTFSLQQPVHDACIHGFSHCHGKIAEEGNLRKEVFIAVRGLGRDATYSPS